MYTLCVTMTYEMWNMNMLKHNKFSLLLHYCIMDKYLKALFDKLATAMIQNKNLLEVPNAMENNWVPEWRS